MNSITPPATSRIFKYRCHKVEALNLSTWCSGMLRRFLSCLGLILILTQCIHRSDYNKLPSEPIWFKYSAGELGRLDQLSKISHMYSVYKWKQLHSQLNQSSLHVNYLLSICSNSSLSSGLLKLGTVESDLQLSAVPSMVEMLSVENKVALNGLTKPAVLV